MDWNDEWRAAVADLTETDRAVLDGADLRSRGIIGDAEDADD